MQMIPGYIFTVRTPKSTFKKGETYKIYNITKIEDNESTSFKYTFNSVHGQLEVCFESIDYAEKLITKISR